MASEVVTPAADLYTHFRVWRKIRRALDIADHLSVAQWLAQDEERRDSFLDFVRDTLGTKRIALLTADWGFWAREDQLPPDGDWDIWLISAGRGFGKTRTGAEWVNHMARAVPGSLGLLIGRTAEETRDVMVNGISGIMATAPRDFAPVYEPSQTRLVWPNKSMAYTFSSVEPDSLRGRNANYAWGDEVASWTKDREVFDNMMKCLRVGEHPQVLLTTTPRGSSYVVKRVMDLADDLRELRGEMSSDELAHRQHLIGSMRTTTMPDLKCAMTIGSSYENLPNMSRSYLSILKNYEGTSDAQSEIHGPRTASLRACLRLSK
jgi:phage terminase large subunit-like protein